MLAIFKKQYRLSLALIVVFGLFLYTVDATSAQIVSKWTGIPFRYEQKAFLKLVYLVILFVSISALPKLEDNETLTDEEKGTAFLHFLFACVFAFFIGLTIHIVAVIRTLKFGGSFMQLEDQWWLYHSADIAFTIGFVLAGLFVLRPAIHSGKELF